MPTVMMMMILEMRSRDMFLQCPCTALTSQAKGREQVGSTVVTQQELIPGGSGRGGTALLTALPISVCSFLWTFTGESSLHRMSEILHSFPSITVLILF